MTAAGAPGIASPGDVQHPVDVQENARHGAGVYSCHALGLDRPDEIELRDVALIGPRWPAREHRRDARRGGVRRRGVLVAQRRRRSAASPSAPGRCSAPSRRTSAARLGTARSRSSGSSRSSPMRFACEDAECRRGRPRRRASAGSSDKRRRAEVKRGRGDAAGRVRTCVESRQSLTADVVEPLLRGRFGRPYLWTEECAVDAGALRGGDLHEGAVAVTEHQTARARP